MRTLIAVAACLAVALPAFATEPEAAATVARPVATLKAHARVAEAHVRLGDLFDGTGDHAGEEVAAAPAPGGTMVFTANWLTAIALSHGISWRAPSPITNIRVERASVDVTSDDIAAALTTRLDADRPDRRVVLDSNMRLSAPTGEPPKITVDRLAYDREINRFTAEIHVVADGEPGPAVHVSGRVDSLVELAVLGRTVTPGDVIRADDVSTTWIRAELAPPGGVADPATLVGKTPRRPIRANTPLHPSDVEIPVVIKRNDLVLIVLERPGMYLTAQGKALEDGGQGAVIKVANTQSNRMIDAVVMGSGRVAIPAASLAQATN